MRWIIIFLTLTTGAYGQTGLTRVHPEEVAQHLVKGLPPRYPPEAEATRILGDVLLEIRIDASGKAFVRRLISGHPMLAPAATSAVNGWEFRPFVEDGKPVAVLAAVIVTFGNGGKSSATSRAEAIFQYNFWTASQSAQAALAKGDFATAEVELKKAAALFGPSDNALLNVTERQRWTADLGDLQRAQQKPEDAEESYRKAISLTPSWDKDGPEVAEVLAKLGELYSRERRFDLARDDFNRSNNIYQKNFKKAGSGDPDARQFYGAAIAHNAWALAKIAGQMNDTSGASKECRTVLEFQSFLGASEHETIALACQQTPPNPTH